MAGKVRPCSGCGKKCQATKGDTVTCRACRAKARTRTCDWCQVTFTPEKNDRKCCSKEHGVNYQVYRNLGWPEPLLAKLAKEAGYE